MGLWCGALALAGLAALAVFHQRTISQLREGEQAVKGDLAELESLRAQRQEVPAPQSRDAELEQLRENTRDLLRLRNEVRQLREQAADAELLRAANAQLLQLLQSIRLSPTQEAAVAAVRTKGAVLGIYARSAGDLPPGALAVARSAGVAVIGVDPNSPAVQSDLKSGDLIVRLDGRPVETLVQLQIEMLTKKPGETVVLDVFRNNELLRLPVKTRALSP
jgi:C-terminal processing protease CtpA/Prc